MSPLQSKSVDLRSCTNASSTRLPSCMCSEANRVTYLVPQPMWWLESWALCGHSHGVACVLYSPIVEVVLA